MPSLRQRIFFFNRSIFAAWKANQSANAIAISGGADEEIHRIQEKQDAGTATPDELQVLSNLLSMKGQESAVYSQPGEKASAGGLVDAFNDLQGGGIFLNAGNAIATNSYLFYLTAIEENAHRYTSNEYIAKTAASNSMMYFNFVSWAAGYDTLSNNSYYGSTDRQKAWNALYNTATSDLLKKNTFRASLVREADRAYGISVNDIQAEIFGNVLGSKLQGVSVYFEETGPVVVEGLGRFYLNSVISFDEYESAYNNALAGDYGKAAGFAALGIVLEVPGKVIKPFKYAGKAVKALFKGSKVVGEVVETAGTVNTGVKLVHGSEKALTTIGDSGKIIVSGQPVSASNLVNYATIGEINQGTVFRYMSQGEYDFVKNTNSIMSFSGDNYFTNTIYKNASTAQQKLSLPSIPDVAVEFKIKNNPMLFKNKTLVQPDYGMPGQGIEFMTKDKIDVQIINVTPLQK